MSCFGNKGVGRSRGLTLWLVMVVLVPNSEDSKTSILSSLSWTPTKSYGRTISNTYSLKLVRKASKAGLMSSFRAQYSGPTLEGQVKSKMWSEVVARPTCCRPRERPQLIFSFSLLLVARSTNKITARPLATTTSNESRVAPLTPVLFPCYYTSCNYNLHDITQRYRVPREPSSQQGHWTPWPGRRNMASGLQGC